MHFYKFSMTDSFIEEELLALINKLKAKQSIGDSPKLHGG